MPSAVGNRVVLTRGSVGGVAIALRTATLRSFFSHPPSLDFLDSPHGRSPRWR